LKCNSLSYAELTEIIALTIQFPVYIYEAKNLKERFISCEMLEIKLMMGDQNAQSADVMQKIQSLIDFINEQDGLGCEAEAELRILNTMITNPELHMK
jgi:hypothetical protein